MITFFLTVVKSLWDILFIIILFSVESGIYRWQSHRFLFGTLLKTPVQPQKQLLELFCKKSVLRNFANFTGKHLCWSLFIIELQAFWPATLLNRDPTLVWNKQRFNNCGICEIFKNSYFEAHLRKTTSEIYSFTWTDLFDNFWLK